MESIVTREERRSRDRPASAAPGSITSEERALALAAHLAEELTAAWRRGDAARAEDFLSATPELAAFPQAALTLVREEVQRRREQGPPPDLEEFQQRFPQWAERLPALFDTRWAPAGPVEPVVFPECGETVGDFRLVAELGRGAQGRVFLAAQTSLADRLVVLKMGPHDCHEHLALARLLHTHIVPLHFVQDLPVHNLRILCMPYMGGGTLAQVRDELETIPAAARSGRDLLAALDRVQASRPAAASPAGPSRSRLAVCTYPDAVCWLGACVADALQYAHERHMLHLDLKPSNVLLSGDGLPLLLDFHLARPPLDAGSLPPGWFGGTPGYMSPEQRLALEAVRTRQTIPAALDNRSDIYSLGVVLFEMLGGEPIAKALRSPQRALRRANRAVSPGLADILAKCVHPDPARRYQEAGALAADLRRHLAGLPLVGAPNRSLVERWRKWRRRRPHVLARVGLTLAAALTVGAAAVLGCLYLDRQRQDAVSALAEGEELLRRGLPEEADRSLRRGQESADRVPWAASLSRSLVEKRREARRAQLAQRLHQTADDLRFRYDLDALAPADAAALDANCAKVWADRGELPDEDDVVRTDLRDLAVQWAALRGRAPGAEDAEARRADLEVLAEAEAKFGPSPVVQYERRRRDPAAPRAGADLSPRTAWDHYALGRALLEDGKTEEAAVELGRAVDLQPEGFWPNFYEGACAYRYGKYAEAEAAFRVCVALQPECGPCFYNHGLAQAALGRPDRARADYDRALDLDPRQGAAWLNRGVLNYQEKRWDEALNDLTQALAHGGDAAAAHYNLALTYRDRGQRVEALREDRRALGLRPDHAGAKALLTDLEAP